MKGRKTKEVKKRAERMNKKIKIIRYLRKWHVRWLESESTRDNRLQFDGKHAEKINCNSAFTCLNTWASKLLELNSVKKLAQDFYWV